MLPCYHCLHQRLLGLLTSFRDLFPAHGTAAAAASGVAMQIFFQVRQTEPFSRDRD